MGAWIEIRSGLMSSKEPSRRTPRWVRGLKFLMRLLIRLVQLSHPTMGAWIEIIPIQFAKFQCFSRTPRWVRGLKLNHLIIYLLMI